jgi:hypothetical protein
MKTITLFTLTVFIILCTQSSCRKVYDYIREHPDGHESLCRITQIRVVDYANTLDTFDITYNAQGNPVSMLGTSPYHVYSNIEQYFRYDHFGRLSDFLYTYINSEGALIWHKYGYPRKNFVTDTVINYPDAAVDGPAPIAGAGPGYYYIRGWTLDAHDRIVKAWSIPNDPHEPPLLEGTITYDANGNKVLSRPDLTYDNKVNPYRTNKIWQFVYNDYSRNNVLQADHSFTPVYNDFGLPLNILNLSTYNLDLPFNIQNSGLQLDLTYACSAP